MSKTLPMQQPTNKCVERKKSYNCMTAVSAELCVCRVWVWRLHRRIFESRTFKNWMQYYVEKKPVLKLILNETNFREIHQKTQNISVHAHKLQ